MGQERKFSKAIYRNPLRIQQDGEPILNAVLNATDASIQHFYSRRRFSHMVYPRQVFCYIAFHYFGFHNNDIAKFIRKDHATVCHSKRVIGDMIFCDRKLEQTFEIIAFAAGWRNTKENRIDFLLSEINILQTELNQLQNQAT